MTTSLQTNFYIEVFGSKMHYLEEGQGDPILFLHGMPTSSFVWRKVIPYLSKLGRCIAPDLIGMGKSDKPDIHYSIMDHIRYLEEFIELLKLKKVLIVMHGWGSILGFHYAMNHEANCKGLVFYEAYLRPEREEEQSLTFQEQLHLLKMQQNLEEQVKNSPYLVDTMLTQSMFHALTEDELNSYREPFKTKNSGLVLYQYWKELSEQEDKSKVEKLISDYSHFLTHSTLPKLLLYSVPGFILTVATLVWAKENIPHLEVIEVGEELHYALESNPSVVGQSISAWLQGIYA